MSEDLSFNADDNINVDVVDDRPEGDRVPVRASSEEMDLDAEIEGVDNRVKKRINRLKYEYHEERRAKDSADRMRNEAVAHLQRMHGENSQLRNLLQRGEGVLLEEMRARSEGDAEKAKAAYKQAYEEGDSDAIAEAQQKMVQATHDVQMASSMAPGSISNNVPRTPPPNFMRQNPQAQQRQNQAPSPDPQAVEWMGRNPWFGKDEEMTSFAYGVHEKLVLKDGLNPKSDEYYARIDERVREVFPEKFGGNESRGETAVTHRTNTVVAPASRSTGSRPRTVQLTATQVALAKRLGITPQQYGAQLLKEQK